MAVGDALSKIWTYGKVEEIARLRTGTLTDKTISPSLALDIISLNVQRVAKRLTDSGGNYARQYITTVTGLSITGSANPYSVDLSSVSPFIDKISYVVHVTSSGTRTRVELRSSEEAEEMPNLTGTHASSLFGVYRGDSLRLYKGNSFTITTASDTIEVEYYRQAKVSSVTKNSYIDVPDAFAALVITLTAADFARHRSGGMADPILEKMGIEQLDNIYKMGTIEAVASEANKAGS